MTRYIHNTRSQGQVLLVGLMLIALVTTVVGTGVLRSITSSQGTKQTEESNKAANIAKGVLEAGINDETIDPSNFTDINPGAYSQTQEASETPTEIFVFNEVVQKDHQYLYYLTDYDAANNTFSTGSYFDQELTIHFGSEAAGPCPILEILEIGVDKSVIHRHYTAPGSGCTDSLNHPSALATGSGGNLSWDGSTVAFGQTVTITPGSNGDTILLVVRPFFAGTKLGFTTASGVALKPQGRVISSTVRTIDGAQRTETVYQAYPQIPLTFFATVF